MRTATKTMGWKGVALTLSTLLLVLMALSSSAFAKVKVVATLPDLGALARVIGGADVDVTVLATASEDPHYVSPRPSFLVALSRADVLIHNGLDLELGWLPPLLLNARNTKIQQGGVGNLDASKAITTLLGQHAGKVDRAKGDIHPGGNPHFLLTPKGLSEVSILVEKKLSEIEPSKKAVFATRGQALRAELQQLEQSVKARFAALPAAQRRVVAYHDSLLYLVEWLGLEQIATVENKPGIKPSAAHVGAVLKIMREQKARIILQEEWHSTSVSEGLARLGPATIVRIPGAIPKGDNLAGHLGSLTEQIYAALTR